MREHIAYLRHLLTHKALVFREGRKLGVPVMQLLLHDASKFLPDEWHASVTFYSYGVHNPKFLRKHHRRNRHHPEWWVRGNKVLPMAERFRLEMLADWRTVSLEKGADVTSWYGDFGHAFPFHPETRRWVELELFGQTSAKNSEPSRADAPLLRRYE